MASKSNVSVVIDAGTANMTALAGKITEEGKIEILGAAKVPSKGIKRGVVLNIDEVASSVQYVLNELKSQVNGKFANVDVSYAGQPVKITGHTGYRIASGEGLVRQDDMDELYKEASNLSMEKDFKILHVIPQGYTVDGECTGSNPVGATGRKIEASYKLIAVSENHLINFRRAFEKTGEKHGDFIFSPIATGEAILTEDEREIGAVSLDIGAGTTKLAVYNEGKLVHAAVIPFGGDVVTNDIREGCSILPKWAEQLKIQYGQALGDFADERKVVTIPGHSGWEPKEISFKSLAFIIQARMEEIIDSVYYQIEQSGVADQIGSGIVISGGAAAQKNLVSLVKFRTGMDARLAYPVVRPVNKPGGLDLSGYLTALGLLKLSLDKASPSPKPLKRKARKKKKENRISPWLKGVVQGVIDYVDDDDDVALN